MTGQEFFRALVSGLSRALRVKYAWVRGRAGACQDNFEYDLAGAPCEQVYQLGSLCLYREGLQALFPADTDLVKLDAESYLGIPLQASGGAVLGHLALIDSKALPGNPEQLSVFRIFADRARAELERLRAHQLVEDSHRRLEGVLDTAMDAIITFDRSFRIKLFNQAAERAFRVPACESREHSILDLCGPSLQQLIQEYCVSDRTESHRWIPEGHTARGPEREFPVEGSLSRLDLTSESLFTLILRNIDDRKKADAHIRQLELEKEQLQEEMHDHRSFAMVAHSAAVREVLESANRVAGTDSTVLLTGETGTGKEMFARYIHETSARKGRLMVPVNCAALPTELAESELFGHEKGAFTGAVAKKRGKFEIADGGTIFLDEIGELPAETQAKILRVLQEHEFEPVGGTRPVRVDVRVIAATNRDLEAAVRHGSFRADLFYRLNVFPIHLPPLRERTQDLEALVECFVNRFARRIGRTAAVLSEEALQKLISYRWPGNIRELANVVERAVILCDGPVLKPEHIVLSTKPTADEPHEPLTLEEAERRHILQALETCRGVVGGPGGAAKLLGLNRTTLLSKMKRLGIKSPLST